MAERSGEKFVRGGLAYSMSLTVYARQLTCKEDQVCFNNLNVRLADPVEARGCSTNTVVIDLLIDSSSFSAVFTAH